jgi:hypothetical protein
VVAKSSAISDQGASSVEFSVQTTTALVTVASAYLFFCPDIDADILKDAGASVSLTFTTIELASNSGTPIPLAGSEQEVKVATSVSGLSPKIDVGKTDPELKTQLPTEAAISFASDSLKFATGATKTSMVDTDRVSLGRIFVDVLGTTAKERDGLLGYSPDLKIWTGKLTIIDGVFSASTAPKQVFLDDTGDCVYEEVANTRSSIPATSITNTVAEWTLTGEQIDYLSDNAQENGMHVCVIADGVKTIEEQPRAPTATLQIGPSAQSLQKYSGRLRHLKENGTKCTLYNIPDGTESLSPAISTDVVSVRITNNGPEEGTLYATLYDHSGKPIYTPKRQVIGTIAPFQTVRYYTGQESSPTYDPVFDLTTYGSAQHWVGQRATVVIATELPDISVFDLVRNRNSAPNMNMSTGATGNGCD